VAEAGEPTLVSEELLVRTISELTDVADIDGGPTKVYQLLARRCIGLFDGAAGVLVTDAKNRLVMPASSSSQMRQAELSKLRLGEGPCIEAFQTGRRISEPHLARHPQRWPHFGPVALAAGFQSVYAVPIRAPDHTLGALNLFRPDVGNMGDADMRAAQALAQVTAVTILRHSTGDTTSHGDPRPTNSDQAVVEQAKGMLAGQAASTVNEAFLRIRRYAQHHHLPVERVCRDILSGSLNLLTWQERSHQDTRTKTRPQRGWP